MEKDIEHIFTQYEMGSGSKRTKPEEYITSDDENSDYGRKKLPNKRARYDRIVKITDKLVDPHTRQSKELINKFTTMHKGMQEWILNSLCRQMASDSSNFSV